MTAYWLGRATFHDVSLIQKYVDAGRDRPRPASPAKLLARDGKVLELEGGTHYDHYYLWEWPSLQMAVDSYNSPEYREATRYRRMGSSGTELVIMDGGDHYTGKY
jgi:uncharacterized protein (DUF1330 family)